MSRRLRIALIIGSCLAVSTVLLLIFTPKMINTAAYRRDVATWLTGRLNRAVGVGDLRLSVITGPKIIMRDLTIEDDPAFSKEPFLTAREVVVSLKLIPLLSGKLIVGGIKVRDPVVSIIEREDASFNISTLMVGPAGGALTTTLRTGASEISAPSFNGGGGMVREIDVEDAVVTFTRLNGDKEPEEIIHLKGMDANIKNMRVAHAPITSRAAAPSIPFSGDISATVSTGFVNGFPFDNMKVAGKVNDDTLRVDDMSSELFGGDLSASGYVSLGRMHREIVINAVLDNVMANKLMSIIRDDENSCFGVLNFEGTFTSKGETSRALIDNLTGEGLVRIEDGHIPSFDIRTELSALGLIPNKGITDILDTGFSVIGGSFVLSGNKFVSSKIAVKSEEWDAIARGEVSLTGAVDFSGDIFLSDTIALDIKPEYITSMPYNQTGKLSLPFNITGNVEELEFLLRPEFLTEKDAEEIFKEFKREISEKYTEGYSIKFINRLSF